MTFRLRKRNSETIVKYHICSRDKRTTEDQRCRVASHPLSVSDAAVVAVISLEVWVPSVPPGVGVTLGPGVAQEAVCSLWPNVHITDGHHLCRMTRRRRKPLKKTISFTQQFQVCSLLVPSCFMMFNRDLASSRPARRSKRNQVFPKQVLMHIFKM